MNEQERHDCEGVENSADIDDAWVRLILTRHAPSVGGWLRSRYAILTAEDVEDIVVIAMIRLWKVRDRFDAARASLRTYFARIADNVARSLISSGWAKARLLEVPLHMREIAAASNDDLRDQAPQDASLMRKLGQALSQLPEAYRTILLADACAPGRVASAEFLSQELQIPTGTVRVYRHRAVTTIRRLLAEAGCKVP